MTTTPVPAAKALDAYFLEARCKLLEVAAILDRIGRGAGANGGSEDPRLAKIRQALFDCVTRTLAAERMS